MTVLADTKQFQAEMAKAQGTTKAATGSMSSSASKFGTVASLAMATAGIAVLKFTADAVNAASDQGEALNKAKVVFGSASDSIVKFSDTAAEKFGITKAAALEAAGGFGAMIQTTGIAEQASASMSIQMVKLAGDMASFNNQDPTEMLERLRSGLAGEAEPLRKFGVFISEARVQTEAYALGIAKAGEELTDAQKVQARYQIILKDTTKQQGDFGRTLSESLPNQMRVAKAAFVDLQAEIGMALLPAMSELVQVGSELTQALAPLLKAAFGEVAKAAQFFSDTLEDVKGPIQDLLDLIPDVGGAGAEAGEGMGIFERGFRGVLNQIVPGSDALLTFKDQMDDLNKSVKVDNVELSRLQDAYQAAARPVIELAEKTKILTGAQKEATAAAREHRLAILALSNSFLGILDSANQVAAAQKELNRLEEKGKEGTKAYEEAVLTAIEAQFGLEEAVLSYGKELVDAGEKQRAVIAKIKDAAREFGIQGDVVEDIIGDIRNYINALGDIPRTVHTSVTTTFQTEGTRTVAAQHGFHGTVSRPTLILAGEAGRERVDISPGGGHGGGVPVGDIVLQIDGQTFARITRDQLLKLKEGRVTLGLS